MVVMVMSRHGNKDKGKQTKSNIKLAYTTR